MGPNKSNIYEGQQIKVDDSINEGIFKCYNRRTHPPVHELVTYINNNCNNSGFPKDSPNSLISSKKPLANCKMLDDKNNDIVKAGKCYELCCYHNHKSFQNNNVKSLLSEYPLANVAFTLSIPKHITLPLNQQITKFESNLTLLSQYIPSTTVISMLPMTHLSYIHEGIKPMIPVSVSHKQTFSKLPQCNKITRLSLLDQNEVKNTTHHFQNKDYSFVPEYFTPPSESESFDKKANVVTTVPSSECNRLFPCAVRPNLSNINCEKQKCKVEPTVRYTNKYEHNSAYQQSMNRSFGSKSKKSIEVQQNYNADVDNVFDFTIEAEKMVSSICNSSPPKVWETSELYQSKCSDKEIFKSDFKTDLFSEKSDLDEYKNGMNKPKFINNSIQNGINEDWAKNTTKYNLCKTPNNELNLGGIFSNQFPNQNNSNGGFSSHTNARSNRSSKINQETLLFRASALKACYDIETILNNIQPKCPEVEDKCKLVKKSIFAAIRDVREQNKFLSDSCLSFLKILDSWISLNSHFENSKIDNLLQNLDPLLTDYFKYWQYVTRMFMEKMMKCLKNINENDVLSTPNSIDIHFNKNGVSQNNPYLNINVQSLNNLNLFTSPNATSVLQLDEQIISDSKTNFFIPKQEINMSETNNFFKEFYSKSEAAKNNHPKNLKKTQFLANTSFNVKTQSTFFPTKSFTSVSKLQTSQPPNTFENPIFISGMNNTLLSNNVGIVKNNFENNNKNVTNLIGPSFFSNNKDIHSNNDQSINGNNLHNNSSSNFKNPFLNTRPIFYTPPVTFKPPLFDGSIPECEMYDIHPCYVKDQNVLTNGLKYNTSFLNKNSMNLKQPNTFNTSNYINTPYYIPPVGAYGASQPSVYHNQQTSITNPIKCIDNDSDTNTSYMKPGFYEVPQKPDGCLRNFGFEFPEKDTPVIGVPFIYSNRSNKPQSTELIAQSIIAQDVNPDLIQFPSKKSDDTWKAALACAESLCETLMMKPTSENKFNPLNNSENSGQILNIENNLNINSSNEQDSLEKKEGWLLNHSLSLTPPELKFKSDWLVNAFNHSSLKNKINESMKSDNSLLDDTLSEKSFDLIKSSHNDRSSMSDSDEVSFFEPNEIKPKNYKLINSSSNTVREKFNSKSKPLDSVSINNMSMESKHYFLSNLNFEKQLNVTQNNVSDDYVNYLSNEPYKASLGLCRIKTQQTVTLQTYNKLQDILDNIWKTDIFKLIKNVNNSKQELQNIELKIKCPTFLQQITYRLQNHEYETTDQALNDFAKFFDNIKITNKEDETIVLIINKLEKIYDKLVEKHFGMEENFEKKHCRYGPIGSLPDVKFRKQKKTYRKS